MNFQRFFKGLARVTSTFTIEFGDFRAQGPPAILVAVAGVVLASGVTAALSRGSARLPETLSEARGLAEALRDRERARLAP
jgi:hypothetical protein